MKHNTIKKKRIRRDCWDLDYAFFKWLEERLPVYLKDAGRIIDLEFYEFEFRDEVYTQKQLIERMIKLLPSVLDWEDTVEGLARRIEVLEIWAMIAPAMWW